MLQTRADFQGPSGSRVVLTDFKDKATTIVYPANATYPHGYCQPRGFGGFVNRFVDNESDLLVSSADFLVRACTLILQLLLLSLGVLLGDRQPVMNSMQASPHPCARSGQCAELSHAAACLRGCPEFSLLRAVLQHLHCDVQRDADLCAGHRLRAMGRLTGRSRYVWRTQKLAECC